MLFLLIVQWWPQAINHLPQKHAHVCFIRRPHQGSTLFLQGHRVSHPVPLWDGAEPRRDPAHPLNVTLRGNSGIGGYKPTRFITLVALFGQFLVALEVWLCSISIIADRNWTLFFISASASANRSRVEEAKKKYKKNKGSFFFCSLNM